MDESQKHYASIVYNSQDMETASMSIDRCVDKADVLYMEYYSAIKWNEMMPFAATWTNLEIIPLSEVNHKKKTKYLIISLTFEPKI